MCIQHKFIDEKMITVSFSNKKYILNVAQMDELR